MDRLKRAFTIAELLVVLGIVAILAAILFPVFRSAKASALKTVCISNFRQATLASQMYLDDYNDVFMLVNYDVASINNPEKDRTWVQLLMPYTKDLNLFICPGDYGSRPTTGLFDPDLVVGDPYKKFYSASLRSNLGYNYLYYCPVFQSGGRWVIRPNNVSQIVETSQSILYVDSVYERTTGGVPTGGGSYIVIPPCRYGRVGTVMTDTFNLNSATIFSPSQGWVVSNSNSTFRYGLAWPWHLEKLNVARLNGSAVSMPVERLGEGCDVRDHWSGLVVDFSKYPWDGL
jgi:prepilin-type N-terminal cleavage/methylation domain-containing protein